MAENTIRDDEFGDDDEVAAYNARCIFLAKHPKNYDFYLEPSNTSMRVIRCRRGDKYLATPEKLQGGFTDALSAQRAVLNYIASIGKKRAVGVSAEAPVQDDEEEFIDETIDTSPPVIDLTSEDAPPPSDLEVSVTQLARQKAKAEK